MKAKGGRKKIQSANGPGSITKRRVWQGEIPVQSSYTAGVGGQIFFEALKERGQLVATRCRACDQTYLPARQFCERCFAELKEQVQVKPRGVIKSFTLAFVDHDGRHLKKPLALALVQLDGCSTLFLHRLLGVHEPSQVHIGDQVKVVFKPKTRRTGSILDIEGFQLT